MADLLGAGFGAAGSLISGIFGYQGDMAAADAYGIGAEIAGQDVQLEKWSTEVQQIQAQKKVQKTIGAEANAEAGAGFVSGGGTAGDLLRESTTQGYMTNEIIGLQGAINESQFQTQQAMLLGEQKTAENAATGALFGGILGGVGKVAGLFF